jgi:hypothetical protein
MQVDRNLPKISVTSLVPMVMLMVGELSTAPSSDGKSLTVKVWMLLAKRTRAWTCPD